MEFAGGCSYGFGAKRRKTNSEGALATEGGGGGSGNRVSRQGAIGHIAIYY